MNIRILEAKPGMSVLDLDIEFLVILIRYQVCILIIFCCYTFDRSYTRLYGGTGSERMALTGLGNTKTELQ